MITAKDIVIVVCTEMFSDIYVLVDERDLVGFLKTTIECTELTIEL